MIQGDRGGDQGQVPQRAGGAGLGAAARPGLSLQITDFCVILVFWDNSSCFFPIYQIVNNAVTSVDMWYVVMKYIAVLNIIIEQNS